MTEVFKPTYPAPTDIFLYSDNFKKYLKDLTELEYISFYSTTSPNYYTVPADKTLFITGYMYSCQVFAVGGGGSITISYALTGYETYLILKYINGNAIMSEEKSENVYYPIIIKSNALVAVSASGGINLNVLAGIRGFLVPNSNLK